MTIPIPAEITAEWICARCGSTNRRLVPAGTTTAEDTCLRCHTLHIIEAEARPVRWRSWLARK
jgi:hypothetical protein